ncbi:MAG TPA: porin [Alcanivoracaceae bacterium]|nr:porin [Alcanivoracaceae bacterium]
MKKKCLLLALGAAASGNTLAADVEIYGRVHLSADYLSTSSVYNGVNFSSNSSRIGFRAKEDLDVVTVFMQLEQQYNTLQGSKNTSGELATRNTFIGLQNDYGTLRIGRFDSPFKTARGPADLFGSQVGDMRALTRNDGFDNRFDNSVELQSPRFYGLQVNLAYSLHEELTNEGKDENAQSYSVSTTYKEGAWDAALAYENYQKDTGKGKRDAVRLAAAYQFVPSTKGVAFYQHVGSTEDERSANIYGLGATYALTKAVTLKGMYMERHDGDSDKDAEMGVVGVEYRIAPPLRVYANYAIATNGDGAIVTPWDTSGGRTNSVAGKVDDGTGKKVRVPGRDSEAFSLGLRYDF